MKILKKASIGLLSLGVLFGGASQSFASETVTQVKKQPMTEEDKFGQIEKFYQDDIKLQNKLKEKIKKGEELDSDNPKKKSLGEVEELDETTIKITYPDGSYELQGIDFSGAQVFDEDGNLIGSYNEVYPDGTPDFESNIEDIQSPGEVQITPLGTSIGGGTTTGGSGYVTVKGATVYHSSYGITVEFKADYTFVQGGYDSLSRVYGVDISAWDWSIMSEGVFRAKETSGYSAYGGVKFSLRKSETSQLITAHLYIRVGGDSVWTDLDNS